MSVPKFVAQLALKLMSAQIEERVHFDILKLRPAAFARNCSVPCVFVIGRQDRLVFPKRVLEIFDAYLGKQKTLIHSNGDHSSEREPHVLRQCYGFIIQEIGKHMHVNRPTLEPQRRFLDRLEGGQMKLFAGQFEAKLQGVSGSRKEAPQQARYGSSRGSYNFDFYLDETRNEERMMNAEERFDEYDYLEPPSSAPHRRYASQSERSMSLMFKKEDPQLVGSTHDISDATKEDLQAYVKEISKGMKLATINKGRN